MMKVLFVSRRFYPDVTGGGQISAYHIAKAVRDLGHEVHVLTYTTKGRAEEDLDGIQVHRFPILYVDIPIISHFLNLEGMYVQMGWRLYRFIGRLKPDVVHLLNIESIYLSSWILKRKKIPSFATINGPCLCCAGDCVDYMGRQCTDCSLSACFTCLMRKKRKQGFLSYLKRLTRSVYSIFHMAEFRFYARRVDKLFPVSRAIEQLFLRNGFSERQLKVVHNPVPLNKKTETDLKDRLSLQGKNVILYAGRVTEEKGVHRMVEAMEYVDDAVFLIVGKGSYGNVKTGYYERLEGIVREQSLGDKVRFIGFVPPGEMKHYYSISDLVVLPGTFYEPLSRMLLEACSYGIPVIASNVGGNPEIVEDGRNGILLKDLETVKLADAVKFILGNPKTYKEMSDYCLLKVEREFSPENCGKALVEEYMLHVKK